MEDETGIANVIISPQLYEQRRVLITRQKFLLVEGKMQNESGVVHVRADRVSPLSESTIAIEPHDFH